MRVIFRDECGHLDVCSITDFLYADDMELPGSVFLTSDGEMYFVRGTTKQVHENLACALWESGKLDLSRYDVYEIPDPDDDFYEACGCGCDFEDDPEEE